MDPYIVDIEGMTLAILAEKKKSNLAFPSIVSEVLHKALRELAHAHLESVSLMWR